MNRKQLTILIVAGVVICGLGLYFYKSHNQSWEAAGQSLTAKSQNSGTWDKFVDVEVGRLEIKAAGEVEVKLRPQDAKAWKPMNLRGLRLVKE